MIISLRRTPDLPMAQDVHVRTHVLVADVGVAEGGSDAGPNPHDLYDSALAACKALTVLWYARKNAIPVSDVQTTVSRDQTGERGGEYRLRTELTLNGTFTEAQLRELTQVAEKCPVHKLMTTVTTSIETVVRRATSELPTPRPQSG
jgi:putative redox protein